MSAAFSVDALGWVATAVFVASYFCGRASTLRRVQMSGALLWVGYGALRQAPPVVAANLLVLAAAAWASWRETRGASLAQLGGVQDGRSGAAASPTSGVR